MTPRTRLLAHIYIVICGGCIVVGIALCLWLLISRDPSSGAALAFIGGALATFSVFYFIPGLIGGLGLLRGQAWARVVLIVLSVIVLPLIPIGTALGIFGLWVLLGPDWKRPPGSPVAERPGAPSAGQKRYVDLLIIAAGVASGFVVMIGTGYRVMQTPGSPISALAYFTSIAVFVLVAVLTVQRIRPGSGEHSSTIDLMHPHDATPETLVSPADEERPAPDAPETADRFTHLRNRILSLARLIDVPAHYLPTFGYSEGNGLPHIEIDGETHHYVHEERGTEYDRFSTTSMDDLLYRIFRDVAWSMSSSLARPHRKPGEDFRREMFKQQLALLDRLNPEWASRCASEHQDVLVKHPFVDDT